MNARTVLGGLHLHHAAVLAGDAPAQGHQQLLVHGGRVVRRHHGPRAQGSANNHLAKGAPSSTKRGDGDRNPSCLVAVAAAASGAAPVDACGGVWERDAGLGQCPISQQSFVPGGRGPARPRRPSSCAQSQTRRPSKCLLAPAQSCSMCEKGPNRLASRSPAPFWRGGQSAPSLSPTQTTGCLSFPKSHNPPSAAAKLLGIGRMYQRTKSIKRKRAREKLLEASATAKETRALSESTRLHRRCSHTGPFD